MGYYAMNPIMLKACPIQFAYSTRTTISVITSPSEHAPGRVLLVHVINLLYPVNIEMLHQIFSKYGIVERIITFQKDAHVFQAFVQFDSAEHASRALAALDTENIYTGCNSLRIQFSNFQEITVKFNNSRSRDYTNPDLPVGDDLPEVVTPPPKHAPKASEASAVVILYNLNPERSTVESIFSLCSFYGHVTKVKFLHSKPDAALVQFAEPAFAALALQFLEGALVFGRALHLDFAKMKDILLPSDAFDLDPSKKFRLFTMKERRYGSNLLERVVRNACKPTAVLHAANISPGASETLIRGVLGKFGKVTGFKWLDSAEKHTEEKSATRMALLLFPSVEAATEVMMVGHNALVVDRQIKLSFSKSSM